MVILSKCLGIVEFFQNKTIRRVSLIGGHILSSFFPSVNKVVLLAAAVFTDSIQVQTGLRPAWQAENTCLHVFISFLMYHGRMIQCMFFILKAFVHGPLTFLQYYEYDEQKCSHVIIIGKSQVFRYVLHTQGCRYGALQ